LLHTNLTLLFLSIDRGYRFVTCLPENSVF
ncbi:MAG: hypothetical protein ACI9OO_001385, partial [Bacteroidia bacterium]